MPGWLQVLLTVPVITAIIGYVTNWAAVKMIFLPRRFIGIGRFGWQGILPRQAHKFASGAARMMTEELLTARDLLDRIDLEELDRLFADTIDIATADFVRQVAELVRPGVWNEMAPSARQTVVGQVRQEATSAARDVFARLSEKADELLDLESLVVDLLTGENTDRLVRLMKEISQHEMRFIVWYGGVFGFIIGLAQAALFAVFDAWWLMPVIGVIVGLLTNYLAIQMIFRPMEPTRYLGLVRYQGLFPKRQVEIAYDYGRIAAEEVLTPQNLLRVLTEGEAGMRIARIVLEAVEVRIDAMRPAIELLTQTRVDEAAVMQIKSLLVERVTVVLPEVQPQVERYLQEKLDIQNMIEGKLARLPKPDFERIIRGLFEEDEATLIIIGGVLGGIVGLGQAAIVVALTL